METQITKELKLEIGDGLCRNCKDKLEKDKLPPRCVLNGLAVEKIPDALRILNLLERKCWSGSKLYDAGKIETNQDVIVWRSVKENRGTPCYIVPCHFTN